MVEITESTPGDVLRPILGLLALACLVFVIIAGIRYTVSSGEPQEISRAKNALIYSIVGLVVVLFAWAITAFVLDAATG